MARQPTITVVVPTRDRPAALASCLRALDAQHDVDDYEVVVVDDASVDAAAVASVVAVCARARLVRAEGRGPAAARNLGAGVARAPVVAFTDDDCRPDARWLATLLEHLRHGVDAVAGPTLVARQRDVVALAAQTITNHLVDESHDAASGRVGFAPTSNLACRAVLHRSLPFDEDFPLAAGEDREWCERLRARDIGLSFEPDAIVWHHPALSVRGFWRQQVRYGRGAHRFHNRPGATSRRMPLRFYVRLLRRGFGHGFRAGVLVSVAQLATAVGVAQAEIDRRRRARGVDA